ncbi:MAG: ferrochelatase [Flavobacteriaceae bacterium]|nr:ferrochelatase [Flavobacteriaceae bacterium]
MTKKGALLINLGSPDSPSPKDVKRYLGEFLMDKRVIDMPYLSRLFLVKGIILNTRPKKSAEAYKKIWWNEGSPLIVLSERLHKKVQENTEFLVELGMRYGKPSIKSGIEKLAAQGVTEIFLIPLYPQFAMATTETITVLAKKIIKDNLPNITLSHLPAFYHKTDYIEVLSNSIKKHIDKLKPNHLLFSYHGIPERHIKKSDVTKSHCKIDGSCCLSKSPAHEFCYRHQCYETTRRVAQKLNLKEDFFSVSFQSRLGRDPWLQPYTNKTIKEFALNGLKKIAVVTPAFVADCLETLEEIGMEAKESFLENGGHQFNTIPCLNDGDDWAKTLAKWIDNWAKT